MMALKLQLVDQPIQPGQPFVLSFVLQDDGAAPPPVPPPVPVPVAGNWPPAPADPAGLVSKEIFNTGAFPFQPQPGAGGLQVSAKELLNDSGRDLLISYAQIWSGTTKGGQCDHHCELFRKSDGSTICKSQVDHYTDGERLRELYHTPYMVLAAGDSLVLKYFAVIAGTNGQAHNTVHIWWRYR